MSENMTITLPLKNEGTKPLKVVLEPLWEVFLIEPGQKVIVYGVFNAKTAYGEFNLGPSDNYLIIYAPGGISEFVDCYIESDGVRMRPLIEEG